MGILHRIRRLVRAGLNCGLVKFRRTVALA
jgi:hypothetical protein